MKVIALRPAYKRRVSKYASACRVDGLLSLAHARDLAEEALVQRR